MFCTAEPASGSVIPMLMMLSPGGHRPGASAPSTPVPRGARSPGAARCTPAGSRWPSTRRSGRSPPTRWRPRCPRDPARPTSVADGHPEQVGGGQSLHRLPGHLARLVRLPGPGPDLACRDLAGQVAQRSLVGILRHGVGAAGGHGGIVTARPPPTARTAVPERAGWGRMEPLRRRPVGGSAAAGPTVVASRPRQRWADPARRPHRPPPAPSRTAGGTRSMRRSRSSGPSGTAVSTKPPSIRSNVPRSVSQGGHPVSG